jgi:hypothetical protein
MNPSCYAFPVLRNSFRPLCCRGAALVLTSILLAGCSKDGGERIVRPTSGDPAELIAWVSVAPVAFHAGEVVQIDVGIRNPTTRPTVVGFTSGSCRLTYAVTDRNDLVVAPGFVCTADAPTYELAPGETIAAKYSWDGTSSSGTPLPPGEYQVHSSGFLYPRTTPVTIQILAP